MVEIVARSNYDQYWRYNTLAMCGGYDACGTKLYVVGQEDIVAQIGDKLSEPPLGYTLPRETRLEAQECHNIEVVVYIVPHTVPQQKKAIIEKYPPFPLEVEVWHNGKPLHQKIHLVNCWSGVSIELKFDLETK